MLVNPGLQNTLARSALCDLKQPMIYGGSHGSKMCAFKWFYVAKSGERWGKVRKSGEKRRKLGKSWKKWQKVGNSG